MGKQVKAWRDAPIVQENNGVDTLEEKPKPAWASAPIVEEPVKKKDLTASVAESQKPSTHPGSEESGAASEPVTKPSGSPTEAPDVKSLEQEYGSNRLAKTFATALLTAGKQLYSGFTEQIPKNIAQAKEVGKSALQSANIEEFIRNKKPTTFQRYVREKEPDLKWYQPFDIDKYIEKHKEAFINEKYPEIRKTIEKNAPEIIAGRLETEQFVKQKNKEAGETLAGIPQSYKQITSPKEAVEYAVNLGAQGLWQIPLTILTKGLSGEMMEAASVYDNQLDALAEKHGISREEVIKKNLDKPAKGQLYALAAAGLDRISAENLVTMIRKGGAPLLKQAIATTAETVTEPIQGSLEETGGAKGAGKSQVEAFKNAWTKNFERRINEGAGGLFGSTAISIVTPQQAISNAKDQIKSTDDVKAIDQHAEKIIESVKQTPEEGVTNDSKNKLGISGEVGEGQKPVETQPVESTSSQEAGGGGVVQSTSPSSGQKEEVTIPVMMTHKMRSDLTELGYSKDEISNLTPGEAHKIIQNETKQVSPGSQQEGAGSEPTYAKDVIGRVHEAVQSQPGEKATDSQVKKKEETALEEEAKKQGHWIEAPTEVPHAEGQEQVVYLDDSGKTVTKINTGVMHSTWKDFMERIDRHNELFPDVAYKIKGFTRMNGEFGVVLEQPVVKGEAASEQEIKDDLEKRGFKQWGPEPAKRTTFHNKEAGVTLKDVHNDNVIKDEEGNLRYIDTQNEPYDDQIYGPEQEQFGIAFAPYREKNVQTAEEDQKIRNSADYQLHQENVKKAAEGLGIKIIDKADTWGGYVDTETGRPVQEVSNVIHVQATPEKARVMAALLGMASPEMQDSVLLGNYSENGTGTEFSFKFEGPKKAQEALKLLQKNGLQYYTLNPRTGELTILDTDNSILSKIDTFNQDLEANGLKSEQKSAKVNAEFIGRDDYAGIIGKEMGDQKGSKNRFDPYAFIQEAKRKYDELKSGPPPPESPTSQSTQQEPAKGKQFAVAKRIEASDANPAIKQGIKEQGDSYIPKGLNVTEQEAQDLIDHHGTDKIELMIKDPGNGLTGDTRVVLSGKLYETYAASGQNVKAVDMAIWAENFLMQAGRAANAGKFWKMITSSGEDQIVLAIERQQQRNQESALTDIDRGKTKAQLEAEFRRLVEEKVQSTVEERLEAAKLITKEKRKEIGDFFDKLKIDTKNNIATAALLPIGVLPHVWNAAVDVIKQAVLTGADVANAIQAGIDHIKANQKEPFDEQKFRDEFTPEVQKIMPKKKIKASDIDPSKIQTPKILGKKKIDFINKVVDAFNKGELTDKKFDEIYASKLGFREFTSEDRAKIRNLAKTIAESEKFDDQLRALPADQFTRENIAKMKGLREAAQRANKDLQEYSQAPADVWDTLIAVMQANLMSTMSLVSNVWYNITYSPLRSASLGIASMLDYGMSKMAKIGLMPKAVADRSIDFGAIQKGYFQGMWNGTLEGLKQLKTGTQADEANLREIHSKFNPSKAVDRWANEDRTLKQKANDYIEGTIGWEAETVFRLLNLGDKPFKRAAELARVMEIGSKKGLKGKELEKFILLPDAESEAEIVKSGQEATFQQSTRFEGTLPGGRKIQFDPQQAVSNFLQWASTIPVIGGPAKVILKSQIPFVKTPLNLIIETIQYAAPPATFATGVYQIAKGNKRSGSVLVGKAIVGTMLWKAATSLFLKGLLTGDDDKDKKKRDFQLDKTPPPNSINTSAISRGLASGDWSIHDGDTWVSYAKMGVAGICLDNYSNIYKERISEHGDISGGPETYMLDMMQSAPRVASSTIEQSFLQGTSSALEALKSGDQKTMDTWLVKTTESVGSILYPNTIATVAKASDDYLRDTMDPEFLTRLKNVYKAKMFMGDQLPPKVSLWGDKVTGNPEGRSKYAYYLFDPSKFKDIRTNDFRYKLYNAFKSDYDADWLPSMPQRSITVKGEKKQLTPKEYAELSINVGKERAALVSAYINSTDQISKDELKMRYDQGYEVGKEKFMISHGMNVQFHFRQPLELRSLTKKLNKQKPKI